MTQLQGDKTPIYEQILLITKQGDRINLGPLLIELNIYEDLFSPVMTGTLTFDDRVGLFDNVPLSGKEKFVFKGYSWNYDKNNKPVNFIHRAFDIVRITDIVQLNDYTKRITLHFASPELIKNETMLSSKGYTDVTISEVIEDLMTSSYEVGLETENLAESGLGFDGEDVSDIENNFFSPLITSNNFQTRKQIANDDETVELFIEKTKYTEPTISFPYMKPFDVITWLSSRAFRDASGRNSSGLENPSANFVFFENKRGFNFISIETLLEAKDISTTKFTYGAGKQNNFSGARKVKSETIREYQIQDCYNVIDNIRNGMYSSRMISYDITNGEFKEIDFDYIESFYDSESTERDNAKSDYPTIPKTDTDLSQRFLSKRLFVINSPSRETDTITSDNTERVNSTLKLSGSEDYLQKRMSQLGRLNNFRMIFEIGGNSKHKVGDMVEIELKTPVHLEDNATNFSQRPNKYYSGYYLLTSICHKFTQDDYSMSIEAVKDAHRTEIIGE